MPASVGLVAVRPFVQLHCEGFTHSLTPLLTQSLTHSLNKNVSSTYFEWNKAEHF